MASETRETITETGLLKEEVINSLDQALSDLQEEKIKGLNLVAEATNAWHKANEDPALHRLIEEELRKRRQAMHQLAPLTIKKHGRDPVRRRYDPNYWLGNVPKEFKGKEEVFILDRVNSLREFFANL